MKSQNKNTLITLFYFALILFSQHSLASKEEEVDDEREFVYTRTDQKGPQHWGDLKKEWAACKKGKLQSPIDLSSERVKIVSNFGKLTRAYTPSNATLKNRGHDISIQWDIGKAGSISINGTEYLLHQAHWHSPSEHTMDGKRFATELHLVHLSKDENAKYKIAVIGVIAKLGNPDPFLSKLMNDIKAIGDKQETSKHLGVVDPSHIRLGGKKYYTYIGSLTVPPCTEGVIWTISKRVRTISLEQVKLLRTAVHDFAEKNSRPSQRIYGREVHLVDNKTPI